MTAYVTAGLKQAADAGYDVHGDAIERGGAWLRSQLTAAKEIPPDSRAYAVYALVQAGSSQPALVDAAWAQRSKMSAYGIALLGLALQTTSDPRAAEAATTLEAQAVSDDREASWPVQRDEMLDFSADVTPEAAGSPFAVLKKPRVMCAVIAQFFYVGAQVGTWSLLVDFAQEAANVPERVGAQVYLEATMIAFCVGRFFGAWLQRTINPPRQLMLYAGCNIALCCLAAVIGGFPSIWALVATSFFMSIMFPTIFALGLEGLGHETEFASSFIVMAICGAAVVPPLMTLFASVTGALHWSMFILAACYAVVVSFGFLAPRLKTT